RRPAVGLPILRRAFKKPGSCREHFQVRLNLVGFRSQRAGTNHDDQIPPGAEVATQPTDRLPNQSARSVSANCLTEPLARHRPKTDLTSWPTPGSQHEHCRRPTSSLGSNSVKIGRVSQANAVSGITRGGVGQVTLGPAVRALARDDVARRLA